jgi:hypothetical protein
MTLLRIRSEAEAKRCLRQAIDVARRQAARLFELRATISLARLLTKQGQSSGLMPGISSKSARSITSRGCARVMSQNEIAIFSPGLTMSLSGGAVQTAHEALRLALRMDSGGRQETRAR